LIPGEGLVKDAAATLTNRRRSHRSEQPALFLDCVVKFFVCVHHVLMSFLNFIKLLLLIGGQQRTNLRRRAIHDGFHLLHRLLMDCGDLRFGLIDDRLDLGLLIGRQVQLAD